MRIRLPFAAAFLLLLLVAGYVGLTTIHVGQYVNDKVLQFGTFFLLTVIFYWIIDTNRRRILNMTLVVCTLVLGVGSEFVQSFLPNNRDFDLYDIIANVLGSLAGLGLCTWYHKRMLERRRQRRPYNTVPGDDNDDDLELGEGYETGITDAPARSCTLEEQVDNWDENHVDEWDEDDAPEASGALNTKDVADTGDLGDGKKRLD
ncbi:hypothetical protein EDB81DRAFT_413446 [Dactylonectria macrodidyma]|uniref:VanZ-like domain-containing protein n=1 Tax=Dactylonectria macrodidyma TaxID=307937 RepID=A0A9P9J988_9HYPO|nr:hypothetical protein EDB81DRAFT_413446 [Dactylonectria macrodidyma]